MNLLKILPPVPFKETTGDSVLQKFREYAKKKRRPRFQKIEDLTLVLAKRW